MLDHGSNVMRDVQWCVTVDYQQIENGNIANQIHGFTIDHSKINISTNSYYYMTQSHNDWELSNSHIWLAEIDL